MTIGIFAAILAVAGGWFFLRAMRSPYKGYTQPFKDVEVRHGLRTSTILKHLQTEGIIRDEYVPLVYMKLVRHNDSIKAGRLRVLEADVRRGGARETDPRRRGR